MKREDINLTDVVVLNRNGCGANYLVKPLEFKLADTGWDFLRGEYFNLDNTWSQEKYNGSLLLENYNFVRLATPEESAKFN